MILGKACRNWVMSEDSGDQYVVPLISSLLKGGLGYEALNTLETMHRACQFSNTYIFQ